jgi:hypothetical protein
MNDPKTLSLLISMLFSPAFCGLNICINSLHSVLGDKIVSALILFSDGLKIKDLKVQLKTIFN